ncbi:MAG: hypothetical protein U5R14_15330 [Gemmatimonadota bacterium]|nr:hypothetical protein [Gemmatimonadota bacterium]
MTDHSMPETAPKLTPEEEAAFAPPSDDDNPAIVDAKKAFVITIWSSLLFVGVVVVFVLL